MAGNPQKNDSESTKIIIGKLIEKANSSIRPVISAFNCLQSRSVNFQRLNQFTVGILESCAEFLWLTRTILRFSLSHLLPIAFVLVLWLWCLQSVESAVMTTWLIMSLRSCLFSIALNVSKVHIVVKETKSYIRPYQLWTRRQVLCGSVTHVTG